MTIYVTPKPIKESHARILAHTLAAEIFRDCNSHTVTERSVTPIALKYNRASHAWEALMWFVSADKHTNGGRRKKTNARGRWFIVALTSNPRVDAKFVPMTHDDQPAYGGPDKPCALAVGTTATHVVATLMSGKVVAVRYGTKHFRSGGAFQVDSRAPYLQLSQQYSRPSCRWYVPAHGHNPHRFM